MNPLLQALLELRIGQPALFTAGNFLTEIFRPSFACNFALPAHNVNGKTKRED
jgi:hypothetical protein